MMFRHLILALTFTTTLAWAAFVQAAPRSPGGDIAEADDSVAILTLTLTNGSPAMLDTMKQSATAGLQKAGVRGVGVDQVKAKLQGKPELTDCVTPSCLRQIGELVGTARFVKIAVELTGMNFKFSLTLHTSESEIPVRSMERSCNVCNPMDAGATLTQAVAEIVGPPPEMEVSITSEPSGASLFIDGQEAGVTPYAGKLRAGKHSVRASLEGYEASETTVEVKEGVDSVQTFQLVLVIVTVEVGEKPRRPFRWVKWAGAAATLGAIGAGSTWLAIHGDPTCPGPATCEFIYETKNQGYIALGVGGVLAAATVYMFVRDLGDARRVRDLAVLPTRGGAMAQVGWRF